MSEVFIKFLNMSITASWLILAVILVRVLLKKAPKWIRCFLWGLVAVRLLFPFSIESVFSLIPSSETIPSNIAFENEPHITSGISALNSAVNPVLSESFAPVPEASVNPMQVVLLVAAAVWIAGILCMLIYAFVSYRKLKKTVSVCVPVKEGIFACDEVKAPFILGIFRPVIYVPSSLQGETLACVIRHENAHLQRRDHWWKPLGFLLLAVYWFNPLCWIAYILLCRDIEMACDEKVIRDMDKADMAAYSQALLDCSFPRKSIAACPLAFGEVGVKERVKGVLNYKKPTFWILLIALLACIVLAVCLMTDPFSDTNLSEKLGVSVEKAVKEHFRNHETEGHFVTVDADVLRVSKSASRTTVYAVVMYEEYSFDGTDIKEGTAAHVPTVITFDTSSDDNGQEAFAVMEYWEPREGSYFTEDVRLKFPPDIQERAFDNSGAKRQHEKCLKAAREYYGVGQSTAEEEFKISYDLGETASYFIRTPSAARVGEKVEIRTDKMRDAKMPYLHVYVNGLEIRGKNLGVALEWYYSFIMPHRDVLVTARYYNEEDFLGPKTADLAGLRKKYPEYFDLDTSHGLELYVWQMSQYSYSCGLLPGTDREKTFEELMKMIGTTVPEMRLILFAYDIAEDDIVVIPWQNPISSYLGEYWVSPEDEDPAAAEKRKQEYITVLRGKFFVKGQGEGPVIDTASLDLDNDGIYEDCTMADGGTSGLSTVLFTASVDGKIKYRNCFYLSWAKDLSFAEKDGAAQIVRDGEYHRLYVEGNRIAIEGLDLRSEGYCGLE